MSNGDLLGRYRSPSYNCADLVADAWREETGLELELNRQEFVRISQPRSPCLVLFRRGKGSSHVGLFVRGKVLHLSGRGPVRQLISNAALGYKSVRFYAHR